MSDHLVPAGSYPQADDMQLRGWEDPRPPVPALSRSPLQRPIAGILRYKWLVIAIVLLSFGAGLAATKLVTPMYEVRASVVIASQNPNDARSGPIRSPGLFADADWIQL